jgi:catechol 2,3-dioxygenase-like lactoylglutathione lyase family enzyme
VTSSRVTASRVTCSSALASSPVSSSIRARSRSASARAAASLRASSPISDPIGLLPPYTTVEDRLPVNRKSGKAPAQRSLQASYTLLNIRVKDREAVYAEWSAGGAQFLTPPKQHQYEKRCYIRDPDGHLIEVGQTTEPQGDWSPAHWPSATPAGKSG